MGRVILAPDDQGAAIRVESCPGDSQLMFSKAGQFFAGFQLDEVYAVVFSGDRQGTLVWRERERGAYPVSVRGADPPQLLVRRQIPQMDTAREQSAAAVENGE